MADQFTEYLILHGRRASTARRHRFNLNILLKRTSFDAASLKAFFANQLSLGRKATYLNSLRDTSRVYTEFLRETSQEFDPTILELKKFKESEPIKSTLSDEEIESFLALPPPYNDRKGKYAKWSLFFSIMAYTGMRPGEVASLTRSRIDWGRNVFVLEETKTFPRLVPIPPNLKQPLLDYTKDKENLFPGADDVDWNYNFHTRIRRLGITRPHLSPYSLRHSFITRMLEEDVNLFKVQKIVGHRKVETTAHYTHLTTKDMQVAIIKHPLIRKHTDPKETLKSIKEVIESFKLIDNGHFEYTLEETVKGLKFSVRIKKVENMGLQKE